jgi:hypothetical protein
MIGWPLAFAWAFACRCGDSSQQATCPHSRHIRRCSQGVPPAKHSSHPSTDSGSRRILTWARCPHLAIPMQRRTNTDSETHIDVRYLNADTRHEGAVRVRSREPRTTRVTGPPYVPPGSTPEEDRDAAATPSHVFGEPAWQLTLGELELADQLGLFAEGRSAGRLKSTASWARPSRAARGSARGA